MLRGERVLLRAIEREDLPWLWEHHNDYDVGTLVNDGPPEPQSLARLEADFDRDTGEGGRDGTRFAIEAAGTLIGRCELFDFEEVARNCKLGISLSKEYWGQAFGREAVDVLLVRLRQAEPREGPPRRLGGQPARDPRLRSLRLQGGGTPAPPRLARGRLQGSRLDGRPALRVEGRP